MTLKMILIYSWHTQGEIKSFPAQTSFKAWIQYKIHAWFKQKLLIFSVEKVHNYVPN